MVAVGIVVTAFNRPLALLQTLHDLRRSLAGRDDVMVAVVDDGSVDGVTTAMVGAFTIPGVRVLPVLRPRKPLRAAAYLLPVVGPYARDLSTFTVHEALRDGFDTLLSAAPELRLLVTVDSDLRLAPRWLTTLQALFERERARRGPLMLTGFHAPNHPVVETAPDHIVKASVGGANLMFDVPTWHAVVRPQLALHWDWHVVAEMQRRGWPLLCTRPSVVQHVGRRGRFSRPRAFDAAADFDVSAAPAPSMRPPTPSSSSSPSSPSSSRRLALCIPTCRRSASLQRLLTAVGRLERPAGVELEVRVVDNDPAGSAAAAVDAWRATVDPGVTVRFAIEPRPGVTHVRNRALDLGPADLVAFIDDDEWPEPRWLVELIATLDDTGADAVIGPVVADLPERGPPWQRPRFRGAPCAPAGTVPWVVGRTGNALVDGRWFFARGLRFDAAFNHTGGEDADLFSRLELAGGRIVSSSATVYEGVGPERLGLSWLLRRQHQHGMNYERIRQRRNDGRHPALRFSGHLARLGLQAARTTTTQVTTRRLEPEALLEVALKAAWLTGLLRQQVLGGSSSPMYGVDDHAGAAGP